MRAVLTNHGLWKCLLSGSVKHVFVWAKMPNWNIYAALNIGISGEKKNDWFFNSFFSCTFLKSVCKNSSFYLQTSMSLKCLGFFKISYSTYFCIFSRIPCGHDIKHCNNIFYLFSLVEYFTRVIITTILLRSMKLTLIPFVEIIWRLQLHSALLPNEYNVPFNNSLNSQMPWK